MLAKPTRRRCPQNPEPEPRTKKPEPERGGEREQTLTDVANAEPTEPDNQANA